MNSSTPPDHGFRNSAKKHLGQHFLHERGVIDKIIHALHLKPEDRVVEIGPGQGALTFPLLQAHGELTAIEFDRDLLVPLQQHAAALGHLHLIHSDVLNVAFDELYPGQMIRLVGNLPYNLSSPILFHALAYAPVIQDMHFMLQKEVVDRMAASPGSKVYGRLSVMLQAYCSVTPLFKVPPGAFRPPPKVDSAVVRLIPKPVDQIAINSPSMFSAIVRDAFGQRRKTLRNSLQNLCDSELLQSVHIDPQKRAEQLTFHEFIAIANAASER